MAIGYNGWTNYETWAVNLWFDDYFTEDAPQYRNEAGDFADYIRETVEESLPSVSGLASDLLNAAMSEVNWYEIAESYLSELPDEENEGNDTDEA